MIVNRLIDWLLYILYIHLHILIYIYIMYANKLYKNNQLLRRVVWALYELVLAVAQAILLDHPLAGFHCRVSHDHHQSLLSTLLHSVASQCAHSLERNNWAFLQLQALVLQPFLDWHATIESNISGAGSWVDRMGWVDGKLFSSQTVWLRLMAKPYLDLKIDPRESHLCWFRY